MHPAESTGQAIDDEVFAAGDSLLVVSRHAPGVLRLRWLPSSRVPPRRSWSPVTPEAEQARCSSDDLPRAIRFEQSQGSWLVTRDDRTILRGSDAGVRWNHADGADLHLQMPAASS